ncbi:hypothetical protein C7H84_29250 [Burkholderia sp. Nafp2/4-1b]|nr:hypothetical protein C7H84_29250 [Burkholderia sp. Nafp2/4-1b]
MSLWRHAGVPCRGKPCPIRRVVLTANSSPDGDDLCRIVRHSPARARPRAPGLYPAAHSGRWHETCTNPSRSAARSAIEQQPKPFQAFRRLPCLS